ncbi:hypothetical protein ACX3P1_08655 [Mesorhizobium sp. A623]
MFVLPQALVDFPPFERLSQEVGTRLDPKKQFLHPSRQPAT